MSKTYLIELIDNEPKISHIIVAENTNNLEKAIKNLINKYINDFEEFGQLHFKNATVRNTVGAINQKKIYYLNEQQATLLLTYLKNSEIVRKFKIKLVSEFFKMREMLNTQSNIKKTYVNLSDSKVREAFYIAFDGICYYSNEKLSNTNFHIDHIQPKAKGGEDITSNLVLCTPQINLIKTDSYDREFVIKHQNIVTRKFAPKVEAILNLTKNSFDIKYLFNSGVMNKLEDLYGREAIKELYSNLIPNLNYKKSQKIENSTTEYFIKNCVVLAKNERLSTTKLYEAYLNFCSDNQISPYNKIKFFKLFRDIKRVPKINYLKMATIDGKKQRYFENLEIVY